MTNRTIRIDVAGDSPETFVFDIHAPQARRKVRSLMRRGLPFTITDAATGAPISLEEFLRIAGELSAIAR